MINQHYVLHLYRLQRNAKIDRERQERTALHQRKVIQSVPQFAKQFLAISSIAFTKAQLYSVCDVTYLAAELNSYEAYLDSLGDLLRKPVGLGVLRRWFRLLLNHLTVLKEHPVF